MSRHDRRKLLRKTVNTDDSTADRESSAIDKAFKSKTIDFGKRINRYYMVDGFKFNTGKRHRAGGHYAKIQS